MIRNILDYIRYSDVWITISFNPVRWKIFFDYVKPNDMDPKRHDIIINILFLKLLK